MPDIRLTLTDEEMKRVKASCWLDGRMRPTTWVRQVIMREVAFLLDDPEHVGVKETKRRAMRKANRAGPPPLPPAPDLSVPPPLPAPSAALTYASYLQKRAARLGVEWLSPEQKAQAQQDMVDGIEP